MEVQFITKVKGRSYRSRDHGFVRIDQTGFEPISFGNGKYTTSSRKEIQMLLHNPLFGDETIQMVTDPELVDKYLRGEQPDKLTEEVLLKVDDEGLRKICKICNVSENKHKNYGSVMRAILENKSVTNDIQAVIDEHEKDSPEEDLLIKLEDAGLIYRNGPWYKMRKGDEEVPDQDYSIGKNKAVVQEWLANPENSTELKKRLKNDGQSKNKS